MRIAPQIYLSGMVINAYSVNNQIISSIIHLELVHLAQEAPIMTKLNNNAKQSAAGMKQQQLSARTKQQQPPSRMEHQQPLQANNTILIHLLRELYRNRG
jgi:hypothetical protein